MYIQPRRPTNQGELYLACATWGTKQISLLPVAASPRPQSLHDDYETIPGYVSLVSHTHRHKPTERMLPAQENLTHRLQQRLESGAGTKEQPNTQPEAQGGQLVKGKLQDPLRALGSKLFYFIKKTSWRTKLVVPSSSERGYFLNLHQCNNATMSIILNQLSFLSCVREEELIFSRSQHGQSYIRIHGRTEMTSLRSPDRQVPKTAAACIGRCLSCSNNYMIHLCNEKNLKQT